MRKERSEIPSKRNEKCRGKGIKKNRGKRMKYSLRRKMQRI
jgi:hypothetical protein